MVVFSIYHIVKFGKYGRCLSKERIKEESISIEGHEAFVPLGKTIPFDSPQPMGREQLNKTPAWEAGAQIEKVQSAPLIFPTPFCENRYQNIAALAERCCYFCGISSPFHHNRVKYRIFSVLHKAFTAFVYRIRAPPSEV